VYCHNAVYHSGSSINSGAWSLEIEVQFYLLAPLLASVFAIHKPLLRRGILVVAAVLFGVRQHRWGPVIIHSDAVHGLTLLDQVHFFLVGFLLADLYLTDWRQPSRRATTWDVLASFAWAAIVPALIWDVFADVTVPCLIFVAYVGAFRGRLWRRIVSTRALYVIGGMCYTIYLYHPFLVSAFGRLTIGIRVGHAFWLNDVLQCAAIAIPTVGVSAVLFALLEKPFMRRDWPTRFARALRGASSEAAPAPGDVPR
jgi:peptidoglycan/LPS O-acetylase OafA/YrhL